MNCFDTKDEVITKIKKEFDHEPEEPEEVDLGSFILLYFGIGQSYILMMIDKTRVCYYNRLSTPGEIIFTAKLPDNYNLLTIPKGTKLWRKTHQTVEQENGEDTLFYAEDADYDFTHVARGQIYTYELSKDIQVINFNKCFRRNVWGKDKLSALDIEVFEALLKYVCEKKGAQGWRAASRQDQHNTALDFDADKSNFEFCMFGIYAERGEPVETKETEETEKIEEIEETRSLELRF